MGYIPYSEIVHYLNENEIDNRNERLEYIRWIQFIDAEYVSFNYEEQKKKKPKQQQPARRIR